MTSPNREGSSSARRDASIALLLLLYTAVVHVVDTFNLHEDLLRPILRHGILRELRQSGFDVFKFTAWFLVPFVALLLLRRIDWGYFGVKRWRRPDVYLLLALIGAGVLAVLSIRVFPSLQDWYPTLGDVSAKHRWSFAQEHLIWTFSWLIGWEFLHRYALLTQLARVWPRFGWLLIPVVEGLYHLQKDPLEMGAMVVFSLVLTAWALRRRNSLLPFLAHLAVEVELVLFQALA